MGWRVSKESHTNAQAPCQLLPLSQQPALEERDALGQHSFCATLSHPVNQGLLGTWWISEAQQLTQK